MSDPDFLDFKRDLPKARKEQPEAWIGKFRERFGDIAMPYTMLIASLTASQFMGLRLASFARDWLPAAQRLNLEQPRRNGLPEEAYR